MSAAVTVQRTANQNQAQPLNLLEPQLQALARHAHEVDLPPEPVTRRLSKFMGA